MNQYLIQEAVTALRAFSPVSRVEANRLLNMWTRRHELTNREWAAVIRQF